MSNKFSNLEKIYFDDVEGKIGNSFIYNISFSQGYSSSASTLQINAISEDADYSSIPSPNFDDIYSIRIGDKIIFRGFIISKEIQTSQNQKIAIVSLVDKSIRLDQYGIGLTNRHAELPSEQSSITVEANGVSPLGEVKFTRTATFNRDIADGVKRFGNLFVIGREKFTSSPCDIPDIEYTQEHFNKAISLFSSEVGITFQSIPNIITARNYTGTIREVLNSLCSDAGQSFYYDSSSDSVILFNLDGKFIDDSIINSLKTNQDIVITDFSEKESLENTYSNFVSVRQMRPGKEKGGEGSCNTPINNLESLGKPKWPSFIDEKVFAAGCLAKVSEGIRDQYCIDNQYWSWIDWWDVQQAWHSGSIQTEYSLHAYDTNMNASIENSEIWSETSTSACFDDSNAGNIFESKCTIDRLAAYFNMEPSEVQQIFDNNPSLKDGFRVYMVNVGDGSYKATQRAYEDDYLSIAEPYYKATYTPKDIEFLNITQSEGGAAGTSSLTDPKGTKVPMCTHMSITQSPSPQYVDVIGHPPGWYFKGGGNWSNSEIDLSFALQRAQPTIIDVTANMVITEYLGTHERRLMRGDVDGTDIRDANFDQTPIERADGTFPKVRKPRFKLREIKHSHLAFVPLTRVLQQIDITTWHDPINYKDLTGSWRGDSEENDCVPWDIVYNPNYRKGNTGCQGSCNDQTLDELFPEFETCGKSLPPGEVCPLYRVGITFHVDGVSQQLYVSSPSKSSWGYRSNLSINYKSNYTSGRSLKINTFQEGTNFAKLNINDVDATSTIFDPESQGNHHVIPETAGTTYDDILNSAKNVYGSFTKGSSENGLPRTISLTINGVPSNLQEVLNLNSLSSYSVNFGTEGLTMSLQYADAPPSPPSMDYLQSRLHNQFHYTTINKFHR